MLADGDYYGTGFAGVNMENKRKSKVFFFWDP